MNLNQNSYFQNNFKLVHIFISITIVLIYSTNTVHSHGRLIEPPSRASAWRYGFNTPPNYNDHELFCGGFTRQWNRNGGKCGVCGDAWDQKTPRPHEYGGTYGQGVIVRKYDKGATVTIRVEITANHNGYFEFAVCPNYKNTTEECLQENVLELAKPQENTNSDNSKRYYPNEGNRVYEMRYKLPKYLSCEHCVLQWRYIAGNNWGQCPNGTGQVGCGPQEEFRSCADIQIGTETSSKPALPTRKPLPTTSTTTTTIRPTETPENTYLDVFDNYWVGIFISFITFLVVIVLIMALYVFYYHGKIFKSWLEQNKKSTTPYNSNYGYRNQSYPNMFNNTPKNFGGSVSLISQFANPPNAPIPIKPPRSKRIHHEHQSYSNDES